MDDILLLTIKDGETWNSLLGTLPITRQDIYFTPEYYSLYEKLGEGKAMCFVFRMGKDIALYPFLMNSINQLGFFLDGDYYDIQGAYGYNGVTSSSYDPQFANEFYKAFNQWCIKNNIVAEFTRFHPLLQNQLFSENHMKVLPDRKTVYVDLESDYSDIWEKSYSSNNRNMIRKALKLGYKCQILQNPSCQEIDKFIGIYYENMNAVGADQYYFFSRQYFYDIFEYFKRNIFLFNVVDSKGETVSSSIIVKYYQKIHYLFSGRLINSDNSINNFLLDSVVKFGKENGATVLFLGGGRTGSAYDSLLNFKANFSKLTKPFCIGHKIHNPTIYEQIIIFWESNSPKEKVEKYKNRLLRYRY